MKTIAVIPLKSVGEVSFGKPKEEVRTYFGNYNEFKKTPFSTNTTDEFDFCHVYYDNKNCCEAIEIFDAVVLVDGKQVFPSLLSDVMLQFPEMVEEYGSFIQKKQSIAFYAPDKKVESILIAKPNYYS